MGRNIKSKHDFEHFVYVKSNGMIRQVQDRI